MAERSTRRGLALPALSGLAVAVAYLPGAGRALDFDSSQTVGAYVRTPSVLDAVRSQRLFNNHPAFSLVEHVIYTATGSAEEWVLRLAPIGFAALTVAVLVAGLRRHLGDLPALCAGLVLATNPTVVELSRSVRGYSLLLLCAVVSSLSLSELLDDGDEGHRRRAAAIYVASVALGVATHLYMVPIVLGQAAVVVTRGAVDREWWRRWLGSLALGGLIYAAMVPDMLDAARIGGRTFKPEFPRQLGEMVVGSGAGALLVAVCGLLGAWLVVRHRRDLRTAAALVLGAVAFTWLVTASIHLEARFHVWLVPAVAGLVAVAVRRWAPLALLVVVGAVLNAATSVDGYVEDPNTQPELGRLLDHVAARGERGCVTNFSVLPILGYTDRFSFVLEADDLAGCDVVAVPFPNLDGELAAAARRVMAVEVTYRADYEDGLAFARDPQYFERICREAGGDICPP